MGIDHSNPYIHSTTVLCDMIVIFMSALCETYRDYAVRYSLLSLI